MNIAITLKCGGETVEYAAEELRRFLERYTGCRFGQPGIADRTFVLDVCPGDTGLLPHGYRVEGGTLGSRPAVFLTGANESALLCAVYDYLGRAGVCFDVSGQTLRQTFDMAACDGAKVCVIPFCRNRGIRQHINFPMDISSYHVQQAQEYIRNLARMRYNCITFHSYTGQWHGYSTPGNVISAGNFFYGQRHNVPRYAPVAAAVSNRQYYCIPEVEPILGCDRERGEFAQYWLNQVISTAKQAGMTVRMSIEFPNGEDADTLIAISRNVLAAYPRLDALEWITPEGGGEGASFAIEDLKKTLVELFGPAVLRSGALPGLSEGLPQSLPGSLSNLKKAIDLYGLRSRIFSGLREIPLQIGLYIMCRDTLRVLKAVMEAVLPEEVEFTFLPAHGAVAVAENISAMGFTEGTWQRTMVYSWAEFDGNMYLLQNNCDGIGRLIALAQSASGGRPVFGICLNHWRNAENTLTLAFAAEAMISPIAPCEFYRKFAVSWRLGDPGRFASAMEELGELDVFNRDNLFNIGFCFLGCWLSAPGLGWVRGWPLECMGESARRYAEIAGLLSACLEEADGQPAREFLRLLLNRSECSVLQIRVSRKLREIALFADDAVPQALTQPQREQANRLCDEAMEFCRQYIDVHLRQMPDRGCEGTIVSYCATIPVYIDHIRQVFVHAEPVCTHFPDSFGSPPPPDITYL